MENIEQIIAQNITRLRKSKGMTQSDLASKLNYSDKAISKWERAESTPDISMLLTIAEVLEVDLTYLVTKHTDEEISDLNKPNFSLRSFLIMIMLCVAVIFITTIVFIYPTLQNVELSKKFWVSFVAIGPLCSLIVSIYFHKENIWLGELISWSALVWTTIATIFCLTIVGGLENFWMLFIVGVPIQAAICVFFFFKKAK